MRAAPAAGATRRRRFPHVLTALVSAVALFAAAPAAHAADAPGAQATTTTALPAPPYDDAGYWAVADRMQARLDGLWDEKAGSYRAGSGGVEPMLNAMMLLTHAVAARTGHQGLARNDHRARLLALRLVTPGAPYVTRKPRARAGSQTHAPGWTNSMNDPQGAQHLVFDAEVVDGLVYAWKARAALQLPQSTADAIASAIHRTARGSFWRWPTVRLNQVNWYATMYAADATVTGDPTLLRRDLSAQLRHFVDGIAPRAGATGNLGPGDRFHYLPHAALNHPMNVDSAEYANIVLSFSRSYEQARRAGMKALSPSALRTIRGWAQRAITGYWTHAGYLNWDSGLGFDRWHQAKKLGLAQLSLIGLASTEALQPSRTYGRYAKYLLDRGLQFADRQSERGGGLPDGVFFGVKQVPQGAGSQRLAVSRFEANAARAIAAGLGRMPAVQPPAMYSYDPDIGRLAVTTPTYNTAVIAVNQRAFPYGGLDLARFYDGDQDVAGGIGGTPPASFGLWVRDVGGRRVLATQIGRSRVDRSVTPLRLTKAPRGQAVSAAVNSRVPYAGTFSDLRAAGSLRSGPLAATVAHRFTRDWIETRWGLRRLRGSARYTADVLFPSTGGSSAQVIAMLRDGRQVTVGATRLSLARVAWLWVRSRDAGYVVVPRSRPAGATVHTVRPSAQSSAPNPGPTLGVQIARAQRVNTRGFSARIAPAADAATAAAMAARLGA